MKFLVLGKKKDVSKEANENVEVESGPSDEESVNAAWRNIAKVAILLSQTSCIIFLFFLLITVFLQLMMHGGIVILSQGVFLHMEVRCVCSCGSKMKVMEVKLFLLFYLFVWLRRILEVISIMMIVDSMFHF